MQTTLQRPIGIFDAGIGSYAIVELVRKHHPLQDIIYFADRASFPYGTKSTTALARVVTDAIEHLASLGATAAILASNAPSIMILEQIRALLPIPTLGIHPPVAAALQRSQSKQIAVIGVASLVSSPQIKAYIATQANEGSVHLINGSPMVARVEDGSFLSDPEGTQAAVHDFMSTLQRQHPLVDTCTLSSTHLPWLRTFFETASPGMAFLDPAEEILLPLQPHLSQGSGTTLCIASASAEYPMEELQKMLRSLGVELEPQLTHITRNT